MKKLHRFAGWYSSASAKECASCRISLLLSRPPPSRGEWPGASCQLPLSEDPGVCEVEERVFRTRSVARIRGGAARGIFGRSSVTSAAWPRRGGRQCLSGYLTYSETPFRIPTASARRGKPAPESLRLVGERIAAPPRILRVRLSDPQRRENPGRRGSGRLWTKQRHQRRLAPAWRKTLTACLPDRRGLMLLDRTRVDHRLRPSSPTPGSRTRDPDPSATPNSGVVIAAIKITVAFSRRA